MEGTDFLLSPIYWWEPSNLEPYGERGQALGILLEETKENVNPISQQSVVCNTTYLGKNPISDARA